MKDTKENPENRGTHTTERVEQEEGENYQRVAMARVTGATLRMSLKHLIQLMNKQSQLL
jgi:hypothetical protein